MNRRFSQPFAAVLSLLVCWHCDSVRGQSPPEELAAADTESARAAAAWGLPEEIYYRGAHFQEERPTRNLNGLKGSAYPGLDSDGALYVKAVKLLGQPPRVGGMGGPDYSTRYMQLPNESIIPLGGDLFRVWTEGVGRGASLTPLRPAEKAGLPAPPQSHYVVPLRGEISRSGAMGGRLKLHRIERDVRAGNAGLEGLVAEGSGYYVHPETPEDKIVRGPEDMVYLPDEWRVGDRLPFRDGPVTVERIVLPDPAKNLIGWVELAPAAVPDPAFPGPSGQRDDAEE